MSIMLCSVAQLLQLHHSFRFLDVNIWSVEFHVQLTSVAITLFTDARMGRSMLLKLIYIVTVNIWSIEFHMQFTIIAMGPLLTYARLWKSVLSRLICIVAELVQGINVHGLCLQYAAGEQISLWMGQMPHRSPELPWIDGRRDWKIFSMASLMICLMLHWLTQLPNTLLTLGNSSAVPGLHKQFHASSHTSYAEHLYLEEDNVWHVTTVPFSSDFVLCSVDNLLLAFENNNNKLASWLEDSRRMVVSAALQRHYRWDAYGHGGILLCQFWWALSLLLWCGWHRRLDECACQGNHWECIQCKSSPLALLINLPIVEINVGWQETWM